MVRYKLIENGVLNQDTGASIPFDEANRHYKKYLDWLEEGNIPEPADIKDSWIAIRSQRDGLLTSCDWTQMPDTPLSATKITEWSIYRQELRDIPSNQTDADNIVWPTEPS